MKRWQKILLVAFHAVMLALFLFVVLNSLLLRWRLGYVPECYCCETTY